MSPVVVQGVKYWKVDGRAPGKCDGCVAFGSSKLCEALIRATDLQVCAFTKVFMEGDEGMVRWTEERLTCPSTS